MSLFRLAFIAAVINIVVAVPSLDAQTMPPTSAEALLEPSDIKGQPADDFYKNLHEQTRRDTPRLIFIPGILGSIIKQCEADSTQCKIIWGDTDSLHKDVDLSIRDDKIYQTDVVDSYFFIDVYGSVITHIRNKIASITTETAADPMLTTFPYDWRLSNSVNATKLADRICDIRKAAPKSPIYILSHSMGGLIAKEWAAHYAAVQCPNGAEPNVEEIAFVATPHLGAPKAIKAVTSGYNLLFDEVDGIMHYFGIWETKHILFALNDAGMSFPSIYELLPIRSSEYCRHEKQNLSLTADPVDSEDGSPLNMFDVNTWKRYDLLRSRIESPTARKVFYELNWQHFLEKQR